MARSPFSRTDRVGNLIREAVAELLAFQVKDPRTAGVTVTDAEVTGDLREAHVFYYVPGDEDARADALAGLRSAAGFIRREVGQRVRLRATPQIDFRFDDSIDRGAKIEKRLRELGLGDDEAD